MWLVQELELRPVELDFRGAALGLHRDRALFADGVCLINALSLVDLRQDPAQLLLCACCGTIGCSSEGWVSLRRDRDRLMLMPPPPPPKADPDAPIRTSAAYLWDEERCAPTLPVIERRLYEQIRTQSPILPAWGELLSIADVPLVF